MPISLFCWGDAGNFSQMALQRCNVNFLARFLGWIVEGEFWEVNFSRVNSSGGIFCWAKTEKIIWPKNSCPKFGRPKFVSQSSALNCGFQEVQNPLCRNLSVRQFPISFYGRVSRFQVFQTRKSQKALQLRCAKLLMKTVLTTPIPHTCKKICPKNMPYNGGPYGIKVGWNQEISTESMAYGPPKIWHTNPLPFMPYDPFLLGVGVAFN